MLKMRCLSLGVVFCFLQFVSRCLLQLTSLPEDALCPWDVRFFDGVIIKSLS